jgi:CubicO group peptidase (beta-lactamase class C family)
MHDVLRRLRPALVAVLAAATLAACSGADGADAAGRSTTTAVDRAAPSASARVPGATWRVDAPEAHGMDVASLDAARDYAFAEGRHTQGVVVVRGGAIVAEWYAPGAGPTSWAASWSMAKSVASALVGIAIGEGKIPSIDEPMTTYFPNWAGRGLGDVTLRDVLEMSSGLQWDESYSPSDLQTSDVIQMVVREGDQLAYAASRPRAAAPGTVFNYTSGGAMLLSGVLQQATGVTPAEYATEHLWGPIGVTQVDMWSDAVGHTLTYCCVDTTTRDFARFGLLYLHHGRWGRRQVVPASWVADSVQGSRAAPDTYGLQWWLGDADGVPADMFSARGHDGQYIYVIPSLDLVVVRNGTYAKFDGPPVADPTLFGRYPSGGLVPGRGTTPPDEWDDGSFLRPIVESIRD